MIIVNKPPLAYFLTWTTYATWVHGDDRGSVDTQHNQPFTPLVPPSAARATYKRSLVTGAPFTMSGEHRRIVDRTIRNHCEIRGWPIHALNVRTNHVHIVCTATDTAPERIVEQCKAWSTRRLREAGTVDGSQLIWTRHASTRYLWDQDSVRRAAEYVRDWQDKGERYD